jgi:hypothetical protein
MTQNELDNWRKRSPFVIFTIGISLYFVVSGRDFDVAKQLIVPSIAAIAAFFYVGMGINEFLWRRELQRHVGQQIKSGILEMIPADLKVTAEERQTLSESEIYKTLNGVFWEAVEADDRLRSQKEHFYSNGVVYSTSIDVLIIGLFLAAVSEVAFLITQRRELQTLAILCSTIAIASRVLITRSRRKQHLKLSSEQLDLLRRRQADFVANRFREIVGGWRCKREEVQSKISVR